ncbi:sulfatase/phosphatase domain-containing protein [Nonomuraea sp. NPDC003201]
MLAGKLGNTTWAADVFQTLTTYDQARRPQPLLAKSRKVADGGRAITFELRDDVTFSTGQTFIVDRRTYQGLKDGSKVIGTGPFVFAGWQPGAQVGLLGDQGIWGKQVALDPSIRIPMIIAGPVVRHPGATSDALVSLEDLAATFLDVAGLAPARWMTARSLLPVVRGEASEHRDHVVSGLDRSAREIELAQRHYGANRWVALRRWRAVSTRTRKLVVSADLPAPALFDLESDPYETADLAGSEPATARELLARLDDDLVATLLCRRGSSTASRQTADHDDVREKSDG